MGVGATCPGYLGFQKAFPVVLWFAKNMTTSSGNGKSTGAGGGGLGSYLKAATFIFLNL